MALSLIFFQEDSVHDSLAITLANMVLSDPTDVVRIYCRALSLTKLTESNTVCVCVCALVMPCF